MAPTHHETTPLFADSLIPTSIQADLPPSYSIRPLQKADYREGFLDVLRVLTSVGDITSDDWAKRYDYMAARNDAYFLIVVVDSERPAGNQIVGTGALVVERKLYVIHSL